MSSSKGAGLCRNRDAIAMKSGLWVNPGRKPTRLGGDGILPYMLVPHWVSNHVTTVLERHGIEFEIQDGFSRRHVDRVDPEDQDKFIFPRARPESVQKLVDSIECPPFPGTEA